MAIIILIPLVILYIVLWSSKSTDKQHNTTIEKKKQKTNLELQRYYTAYIEKTISQELETLIKGGIKYNEAVVSLFHKYNMPLKEYFEDEIYSNNVSETPTGLAELIVRKQMAELGYKYSYDNEPSLPEKLDKNREVMEKMKKDYWWM